MLCLASIIYFRDSNGYSEGNLMSGHSGFVACVCVIPPNDEYPQGLVATGSNDSMINVYSLELPAPLYKLEGHKGTGTKYIITLPRDNGLMICECS